MDGDQVRHRKRAVEHLLRDVELLGINHDRQGRRQALIAAAGIDDDRQIAAVHARIRPCSGVGLGAIVDARAVRLQQNAADVRTVVPPQAFLGNRPVQVDLPLEDLLHIGDLDLICKGDDILDRQQAAVGRVLAGRLLIVLVLQHDTVFLHTDHVGVEARDLDEGAVRSRRDAHLNVKHIVLIRTPDGERRLLQIGADGLYLLRRELREHLKLRIRVVGHDARRGRGRNAAQAVRIRNDDALDIFDDVRTCEHLHRLRQRAERLARKRRTVSHGDGLGTAHGGLQFLFQDRDIFAIDPLIHDFPPNLISTLSVFSRFYNNTSIQELLPVFNRKSRR